MTMGNGNGIVYCYADADAGRLKWFWECSAHAYVKLGERHSKCNKLYGILSGRTTKQSCVVHILHSILSSSCLNSLFSL